MAKELGLLLPKQNQEDPLALGLSQRDAGHYIGAAVQRNPEVMRSGDVLLSKIKPTLQLRLP